MKLLIEVERPEEEINCEILLDHMEKAIRRLKEERFEISEISEIIDGDEVKTKISWEGIDDSESPLVGSHRGIESE